MTATTGVQLTKNDGSQEFNLKVNRIESTISNNFLVRGVLEQAGEFAGSNLVANIETYQIQGIQIQDVDSADYPSGLISNELDTNNASEEEKMENALRHAALEWGPTVSDNFDELTWGNETVLGAITEYRSYEDAKERKPDAYVADIEWTHASLYANAQE